MASSVLDQFHPLIRRWFTESLGEPTGVQLRTWAEVMKQRHVLVTAPTGSGKTMAAGGFPGEPIYWVNAADPASLCGSGLEGMPDRLPARLPSTHMVYHGVRLVLVSKRHGKELEILVPPGDLQFPEYLSYFSVLLTREFNPAKRIFVERINGGPAAGSAYAEALKAFGFQEAYKGLELWRRY